MAPTPSTEDKVTDISEIIGIYGTWQRRFFIWVLLGGILSCWLSLVTPFLAPEIDFWCQRPQTVLDNMSVEEWKVLAIPTQINLLTEEKEYSKCTMYETKINGTNEKDVFINVNKTVACEKFEFDHSIYSSTLLEEWNLVCEDNWLISLSQSAYMAGFLVAVLVLGQASDRLGRLPVMLLCFAFMIIAGLLGVFAPTFTVFIIARFFIGLGNSGLFTTAFIYVMESVGPNHRIWLGVGGSFGFSFGCIILPWIAWLIRDWFLIQLAITLPTIALGYIWWWIPESPRWLISQGKMEKAEEVTRKIMKINRKECADVQAALQNIRKISQMEDKGDEKLHVNVFDLLRKPSLRKITLYLFFIWIVTAFVFYGITLNTNELSGDPFINFFISGVVEIPACIMAMFSLRYYGRKTPLLSSLVSGGVVCFLAIIVPADIQWLKTTFLMLGKLSITGTFAIIYVYTAEIFPTVVRNVGLGCCSTVARIGSITSPFVKELSRATHPNVPFGLYGTVLVISGLLVLLLPETHKRTLMDTLEQGEHFHRPISQNKGQEQRHVSTGGFPFLEELTSETKLKILNSPPYSQHQVA
ncbi:organic cation transporter protein-like [Limulus polyphemus]|uniref:Organic cation transporter protein-like n=1 Tax=Limulus polyphemus TaxID=6850 RepID=A0ABM1SCG9_LIMPO|nr:organic cation transporter protein-like [Limulus polyphemus]XP_022241325.1 organic cation transporter protein-like [Limulus polyphemus]